MIYQIFRNSVNANNKFYLDSQTMGILYNPDLSEYMIIIPDKYCCYYKNGSWENVSLYNKMLDFEYIGGRFRCRSNYFKKVFITSLSSYEDKNFIFRFNFTNSKIFIYDKLDNVLHVIDPCDNIFEVLSNPSFSFKEVFFPSNKYNYDVVFGKTKTKIYNKIVLLDLVTSLVCNGNTVYLRKLRLNCKYDFYEFITSRSVGSDFLNWLTGAYNKDFHNSPKPFSIKERKDKENICLSVSNFYNDYIEIPSESLKDFLTSFPHFKDEYNVVYMYSNKYSKKVYGAFLFEEDAKIVFNLLKSCGLISKDINYLYFNFPYLKKEEDVVNSNFYGLKCLFETIRISVNFSNSNYIPIIEELKKYSDLKIDLKFLFKNLGICSSSSSYYTKIVFSKNIEDIVKTSNSKWYVNVSDVVAFIEKLFSLIIKRRYYIYNLDYVISFISLVIYLLNRKDFIKPC